MQPRTNTENGHELGFQNALTLALSRRERGQMSQFVTVSSNSYKYLRIINLISQLSQFLDQLQQLRLIFRSYRGMSHFTAFARGFVVQM